MMTREIKFRALDKKSKEICKVTAIDFEKKEVWIFSELQDDVYKLSFNEVELMQFTGLKDKNGKEIFEGDILKQGEGEHETLIEVKFGNGTFDSGCYNFTGFYGVYLKIGFGGGFSKRDLCESMDEITKEECERREVIGNIWENKELLKNE